MITRIKSKKIFFKSRINSRVIYFVFFFVIIVIFPNILVMANITNNYQENTLFLRNSGSSDQTGLYEGRISTVGRKTEVSDNRTDKTESTYIIQHYQVYEGFNYSLNSMKIRAYNLFNGSGDEDIATNDSEYIEIEEDIPSDGYIGGQGFTTPDTIDLLSINNVSLYIKHDYLDYRSPIYFVYLLDKDFQEEIAFSIKIAESGNMDGWVTFDLSNNILEPNTEYNLVYFLSIKSGIGFKTYNISTDVTWMAENKSDTSNDKGWTYYFDGNAQAPIKNNDTIDMLCNYSYQKIINPASVDLKCEVDGIEYTPTYQKSLSTGSLGYEAELNYGFSTSPIEDVNVSIFMNDSINSLQIEIKQYYIYEINASGFYTTNNNNIEWNIIYQNYDFGAYEDERRFLYESDWDLKQFYNTIGTPVELASIAMSFYNETYMSLFDPEGTPLGNGECSAIYQSPNYCDEIITNIKDGSQFEESSFLQLGETIKLEALIRDSDNEPISGGKGSLIFKSPSGQIIFNGSDLESYSGVMSSSEILLDLKYGVGSYTIDLFWTNGKEAAIYTLSVDVGHPEGYIPPETMILIISLVGVAILATPAALVIRKHIRQINWEKKLNDLFVLTKEGSGMYSFSFGIELRKPELIAGMISALTTFMKEATGSKEALRIIDQQDKKIILNHGKFVTVALICTKDLPIIHKRVKKFTEAFESRYGKQLLKWTGEITMFKDADLIVKKFFPVSVEEQQIRGVREKLLEFRERLLSVDEKEGIISILREITEFSSRYQQIINNYSFKDFNELIRIAEYKINE